MYRFIVKPVLFLVSPELAHAFSMRILHLLLKIQWIRKSIYWYCNIESDVLKKEICGITFKNPVGLAAGFDKDGDYCKDLAVFGFGFIEVGTVTPLPQPGNDKPRLFRLTSDHALINRMGFNNKGADHLASKLKEFGEGNKELVLGANFGKNKITTNERAFNDYILAFTMLVPYANYMVVNVSSPNTPGLRALQEKEPLKNILKHLIELKESRPEFNKPLFLKIAPDLNHLQLDDIISLADEQYCDGIIATNTSLNRSGLTISEQESDKIGDGGLSGKPINTISNQVIRYIKENKKTSFPIIGVGGIHSAKDAIEKLKAGADLVQIYTGFIYEGPLLIRRINKSLIKYYSENKTDS